MKEQENKSSSEDTEKSRENLSPEELRQGRIVLYNRRRKLIFFGGLILLVIVLLAVRLAG